MASPWRMTAIREDTGERVEVAAEPDGNGYMRLRVVGPDTPFAREVAEKIRRIATGPKEAPVP